jgi:uncharacterized membrane protein
MNPLKSVLGTIVAGFILAFIMIFAMKSGAGNPAEWVIWIHAIVGVLWIGLLYYFNFVQVPAVGKALAEAANGGPGAAAINKYIAPPALAWFRYAALLTWITGAVALAKYGILGDAFMLKENALVIGIGAWLGTIMLFNVWVLIWPNQKKILGMVESTPEAIAKAKVIALMASRTNTMLSIPMLLAMTASSYHNGGMPL